MLENIAIILVITLLVGVLSAPAPVDEVQIDSYNYKSLNDQNIYKFDYKLSDGQERSEEGYLRTDANGDQKLIVSGSYRYLGPDGVEYSVFYTADENGFQPSGAHLPGSVGLSVTTPPLFVSVLELAPNAIKSLIG